MNARDHAVGGPRPYPSIRMMLAHQNVADLRRRAARAREPRRARPVDQNVKRLGSSSRLPNGSWLYGRRDSS
jgi:hypothetical protein